VARYVDMPLQHIHDNMLERMRRETSRQYIVDLIARIRARVPGLALRTTFIVGFPRRDGEYFQTLLEFIRRDALRAVGRVSPIRNRRERARPKMEGHIAGAVKKRRQQTGHGGAIKDRPGNCRPRASAARPWCWSNAKRAPPGFGNGSGPFVGARLDPLRLRFAVPPRGRGAVLGGAQRGGRAGTSMAASI